MNTKWQLLYDKWSNILWAIFVLFLFVIYILYHNISGNHIREVSTKVLIKDKIINNFIVAQNNYTCEFTDGSKFILLAWPSKRGLFSELIIKGDTINKDSNSNLIIVKRGGLIFKYYLVVDTNNSEWKKKNLPNREFMDE